MGRSVSVSVRIRYKNRCFRVFSLTRTRFNDLLYEHHPLKPPIVTVGKGLIKDVSYYKGFANP